MMFKASGIITTNDMFMACLWQCDNYILSRFFKYAGFWHLVLSCV